MVRRAPPRILPANCISHLARPRSRRWNTWLQQRELQVDDLCEDVKTGVLPINLYGRRAYALTRRPRALSGSSGTITNIAELGIAQPAP